MLFKLISKSIENSVAKSKSPAVDKVQMQKYIAQVKDFFKLIKQHMDKNAANPKISAAGLAKLRVARCAVAEIERKIISDPYGIIWVDLARHFDCVENCTMDSREKLRDLFLWANRKSPVNHVHDARSLDGMARMGVATMFDLLLDPNTLLEVKHVQIQPKTVGLDIKHIQFSNEHTR